MAVVVYLKNWSVRRSGAGMTVSGVDADAEKIVKFSGVYTIGINKYAEGIIEARDKLDNLVCRLIAP